MENSQKGIVVLGFPRSGTTLVRRLLDAHPNIACPGETCILSASARFLHSELVADGLEYGVINGLSFAGFERAEILGRLRKFAFSFHNDYARNQGKPRWAEKTAVDIFHLNEIEELCGDQVQYICIVRHGLDVACSLQEFSDRGFTYLSEIHDYICQHPRPLEAFAHAWVDRNRSLLEFVNRNEENTLLVCYEDLVVSPNDQVERIFDFLGEEITCDLIATALKRPRSIGLGDWKTLGRSEIDSSSVQRWQSLPPFVVSRLAEVCNPTLEAFGYEAVMTRPPSSQSSARRKYEFALLFGAGTDENSNS